MKTCQEPDRHNAKLICGYPMPCPHHSPESREVAIGTAVEEAKQESTYPEGKTAKETSEVDRTIKEVAAKAVRRLRAIGAEGLNHLTTAEVFDAEWVLALWKGIKYRGGTIVPAGPDGVDKALAELVLAAKDQEADAWEPRLQREEEARKKDAKIATVALATSQHRNENLIGLLGRRDRQIADLAQVIAFAEGRLKELCAWLKRTRSRKAKAMIRADLFAMREELIRRLENKSE